MAKGSLWRRGFKSGVVAAHATREHNAFSPHTWTHINKTNRRHYGSHLRGKNCSISCRGTRYTLLLKCVGWRCFSRRYFRMVRAVLYEFRHNLIFFIWFVVVFVCIHSYSRFDSLVVSVYNSFVQLRALSIECLVFWSFWIAWNMYIYDLMVKKNIIMILSWF